MSPDVASAVGSVSAAVIALLAIGVSIYAAIIARQAARSTEAQAAIAAKSYRLSATPKITAHLGAPRRADWPGGWYYTIAVRRDGGPPEVWWRMRHEEWLETNTGRHENMPAGFMPLNWNSMLYDGVQQEMSFGTSTLAPEESIDSMKVYIDVEMIEAPGDGVVSDGVEKWTHKELLEYDPSRTTGESHFDK